MSLQLELDWWEQGYHRWGFVRFVLVFGVGLVGALSGIGAVVVIGLMWLAAGPMTGPQMVGFATQFIGFVTTFGVVKASSTWLVLEWKYRRRMRAAGRSIPDAS